MAAILGGILSTASFMGASAQTGIASLSPATISVFAGGGSALGDGGPAISGNLSIPRSVVFDSAGNLYIADSSHYRVRKVTPAGVISTLAGTGTLGQTGNGGQASAATLNHPASLAIDPTGALLYVAEDNGNDVRVINLASGVINLFAGTGVAGNTGDGGLATLATFNLPSGLAVDVLGNVYVADSNNNRVRRIVNGTVSNFAGTGLGSATGDGGQATLANLYGPRQMAFDAAGSLYIADYTNSRIRRITIGGVISTVAGTGVAGFSGDGGIATAAQISQPRGVSVDAAGDLLIADGGNNRIRKVDTAGVITTIAGGAATVCAAKTDTYGDGCSAMQATLALPFQAIADTVGNLYIADFTDNLIRRIVVGSSALSFGNQAINTSSATQVVTLSNTGSGPLQLSGRSINGAGFAIAASGGSDCTATTLLAPGAGCLLGVQFAPTATGAVTGTLTLTDNQGGSAQQTISLTGTGIQPSPVVALTITPSSVMVGQSVTFSATVSYSALPIQPTGTVQFLNGANVLGMGTIVSGVASFTTSTLPPATYSVTASYGGNASYLPAASGSVALTVAPLAGDSISFTATPVIGAPGSTTSLAATVMQSSGTIAPTGNLTFLDGSTVLSMQTLASGKALFAPKLAIGSHSLTAVYSGDANYVPLTSQAMIVTIGSNPIVTLTPGVLSTFAGTGVAGSQGNGAAAILATLNQPTRSAFDRTGNLYFADTGNNMIRMITPGGTISLFAGSGGTGHTGDNGQATLAQIGTPRDVALDSVGNVYVIEAGQNDIRRIDTTGVITTYAGIPAATAAPSSGDGGPAIAAYLNTPRGIAFDSADNLYIAEQIGNVIRKVTPAGIISTIAGTAGITGNPASGVQASTVLLNAPYALATDPQDNLYIVEVGDNSVRKISAAGVITLLAGGNGTGHAGDGGPAKNASLNSIRSVAADAGGNVYIADANNYEIRKVDASGTINTIAGSGVLGSRGDGGPATAGAINQIYGISLDANGNLYLSDQAANVIRKVAVGGGLLAFPNQIPNTASAVLSATVNNAGGLPLILSGISFANANGGTAFALAPSGGTDCTTSTVLGPGASCLLGVKFSPAARGAFSAAITLTDNTAGNAGSIQTIQISGTGSLAPAVNLSISPASVPVGTPITISVAVTNSAYPPAGTPTGTVNILSGTNVLTTLTLVNGAASFTTTLPRGTYSITATYSGDTSFDAITSSPVSVSVSATNTSTMLVASAATVPQGTSDLLTATITGASGTPTGSVSFSQGVLSLGSAIVVNGIASLSVYLPATGTKQIVATYSGDAFFNPSTSTPLAITVTSGVVASLTPGVITTLAGAGTPGFSGDGGPASMAMLNSPGGSAAVDLAGNVYVADTNNNRIRMVTPAGIISTIAGTGVSGSGGDGGPATAATFNAPRAVAVDASGNLFILDAQNFTIRKINPSGVISTYAGIPSTAAPLDTGDGGPATAATINTPRGLAVDANGNLYIAENSGAVIREVNTQGIITTVAGSGIAGNIGNGGAASIARLNSPNGVAFDAAGNFYIADTGNHEVRKVTASTGIITVFAGTGTSGYSGDNGLASSARLSAPRAVGVDAGGNVYIGDTGNNVVRKVDTDGYISTIAGTGISAYSGDSGSAAAAQLGSLYGITVDSAGSLYVVDFAFDVVRKITTSAGLVNFGNVPFGSTAVATVSLGNAGSQPLIVSGIAYAGSGFTESAPSSRGCTTTSAIAPGSECLLTSTFTPPTLGPFSGTITFKDNAGKDQIVALTGVGIKLPPTLTLTSTPANYAVPGGAVSLTIKVTSTIASAPVATGTVQLLNGATVLGTSTLDATGSATFSLGSTLAAGTYHFSVAYAGDANFQPGTSSTLVFGVQNDFTIALSSLSGQVSPGGSLTTTLTITPTGLSPNPFQLACANQPTYIVCTFSPATLAASDAPLTSTLTITAKAPPVGAAGVGLTAVLSLLLLLALGRSRNAALRRLLAIVLLAGVGAVEGCGSGITPTPSVVPVTVTVTSAQATHTLVYNVNFY